MILGPGGAGKSSTINYLYGSTFFRASEDPSRLSLTLSSEPLEQKAPPNNLLSNMRTLFISFQRQDSQRSQTAIYDIFPRNVKLLMNSFEEDY
jgi:GTPase SAR1 family protein